VFFLLVLVAPLNPGAISPSSIVFGDIAPGLGGATKTNKKNTIDEGDIAPGLGEATKTSKKNTIDEGDIAPGLGGATKTNKKNTIDEGDIALPTQELYLLHL
jgi:hypothetical protein